MVKIRFSKVELRDLFKAWVIISIAVGIVLTGGVLGLKLFTNVLLAALTVGIGFLFHEMGHKIVAQKYGCFAEFRADNYMLLLAIITSFFGIVFAAPGAVWISGHVGKNRNGKIALAGPATNIGLAVILVVLSFFFDGGYIGKIISLGLLINVWLALFNLLPFWILDGKKILSWDKTVYLITLGLAIALFVLRYFLPSVMTVAEIIG
ncbi:metalloprotease [archaeon]|jgi:Zn-dependent protease|nr:metalloprotease [archaeon]MBT4417286.1 metalloprotease [archaeon]